jgi:hypothetical protein
MKRNLKQNRIIHQLLTKHGLDAEDKKALVIEVSNGRVTSSAKLNKEEANALITRLGGTPPRPSRQTLRRRRREAGVKMIATQRQLQHMERIWQEFNHRTDGGLKKFCRRVIKADRPRTTEEANRVIEGIKAMNLRTRINYDEAA